VGGTEPPAPDPPDAEPPPAEDAAPAAPARKRRRLPARMTSAAAKGLVALSLSLLLLFGALVVILDTNIGHRFIVDRISALAPESGLRVRIGRIDGSIWGRTRLRDVRLYDPQGLFAEAPQMEMDWRPLAFLANRLLIHELESDLVILHRAPELIPAEEPRPILPDFDLHIGRLDVRQLRIGAAIAGEERSGSIGGEIDIRRGRALVDLDAAVRDGGDRLALRLDAEPDRDRFDLALALDAPAGGVAGALIGTQRPLRARIEGAGSWTQWRGRGAMDLSGRRTAELRLAMEEGRFGARGWAAPSPFLQGKLQRLTAPRVAIDARGRFDDRTIRDARVSLRSAALRLEARGGADLRRSRYASVEIAAELLRPEALFTNMTGRQVRIAALLDGPFGTARFAYRAAAPTLAFDDTGFETVRIEGSGRLSRAPVLVPVAATARRVTGQGEEAERILANLAISGALRVTPALLAGEGLAVRSDWLRGRGNVQVNLRTGDYAVALDGGMQAYPIDGFGLVDVTSRLRAVPGPGLRGTVVTGTAEAAVRRLDNEFLAWLGGGLPRMQTGLERGTDGILRFVNLRVAAPELQLAGRGERRRDGTFRFDGQGRHTLYGPVMGLSLDGPIERPRIAVRLPRPLDALGLADVALSLDPTAEGFAWRAAGGSTLGPFEGRGAIRLPPGQRALIDVAALDVSGTRASGILRSDPGGFTGRLDVTGGGVNGRLVFDPWGGHQRIAVALDAQNARFLGPPPIQVSRASVEGVVLLDPAGTSIEGRTSVRGLSRGDLSLANLQASASLRGGVGEVRASVAGARARAFAFDAVGAIAPGRISITGAGRLDRRPIELLGPAVLTRTGEDWRLAPTGLRFAGGEATVGGYFGRDRTDFDARLESMPLTVLDIFAPDLGLGGIASGRLRYRAPSATAPPAGEADLRIRGLTRAGLVLASRPVDIGVNARLEGANAAMRAVAVSDGRTVGRAQARIVGMGGGGNLFARMARAPMQAQLRYEGPADTLWRLTGIELIDLSGPAAIGANLTGTLENPSIVGSVRAAGARLESAVTGMVIEGLDAAGRFDGSELRIARFTGRAGGGTVAGSGTLDFAGTGSPAMRFDVQADNARLLDRDDIRASVTGPLTIRSDGRGGGTIGGDVRLTEGRFRLGSATAAAEVPRLPVREINRPDADLAPAARRVTPWRLALTLAAPRGMNVTGLGLTSEWSADLRVAGTVTEPRITGAAELVRGTYDFAGRRFDLTRGNIRFQGESPVNPQLDIAAEARVRGLAALIRVTGTSARPEIAFTSTPALPQDELLSRILFGTSITNLTAPEAIQLAAAVASLNDPGGGLDPINAVRRTIGLDRLRIVPADLTQGTGTALAAGKYLGRRVYVEVVTDARGYSATTVEYQITRWLSLLSTISTIGRESVNLRVSRDY
jgi:translocation and assembly module TamB